MEKSTCIRVFANENQIRSCREKIHSKADSLTQLAKVLDLSGNEVRLKVLYLLSEEKELCPCDISDILNMSVPAISQHLRKLKDAEIIESRRESQTIYYSIRRCHLKILKPFFRYINDDSVLADV
jgi:ArsR family transcriptional regulator, lead/cadmium/zinc/bismuth-responsive transcriptional repressor